MNLDIDMWVVAKAHVWLTPNTVQQIYGPYIDRKEAVHVKNELMARRNHQGDALRYSVRKLLSSKWDNFNN